MVRGKKRPAAAGSARKSKRTQKAAVKKTRPKGTDWGAICISLPREVYARLERERAALPNEAGKPLSRSVAIAHALELWFNWLEVTARTIEAERQAQARTIDPPATVKSA